VALVAAGCGSSGTLSAKALEQQAAALQAAAAEGGLAAGDAARGRSTATFVRVHGRALRDIAAATATSLATAEPAPGVARKAQRATRLGKAISADLDALSRSGSDHAQQRALARRLDAEAARAKALAS
jgi:hypothetical protein